MRVVFIGTGEIGVPTLKALHDAADHELVGVVTQPDKPAGRAREITSPPVKIAARDLGVPILQPARIKFPEAIQDIRNLAPEVVAVMAYGQILPRAVLEIPSRACLNLHASLLPKYRGAAPIQAAIAAGETTTGITVMYVDEGLDTGDLLLARELTIAPDETGSSLHDRLAQLAPEALLEALKLLGQGKARRIPQDAAKASYASKLQRDDGKIDWTEPEEAIERKIRAYDPWPGAFTMVASPSGKALKLKIFRASVSTGAQGPGQIISVNDREFVLGARDGGLSMLEVQLEGKKRMSAGALLRGYSWISSARIS